MWSFCGSGKTAATLSALDVIAGATGEPILIVAPPLVAAVVWPDEVLKWKEFSHLTVSPLVGNPKERFTALHKKADIYTISFENLAWLSDKVEPDWPFKTVVVDEATKLRGVRCSFRRKKDGTLSLRKAGSKRACVLATWAFSKVDRFIELTGTPAPNGIEGIWGQAWFLDAGKRLGNCFSAFANRWFTQSHNGFGLKPLPNAEKEIRDRITDVCFAVRSEDWFDLEKPIVRDVFVDLPEAAKQQYRDMEREMYIEIGEKGVEAVNAGGRDIRCAQIANGAIYSSPDPKDNHYEILHDAKLEALENIVAEANGMPVLVVWQFAHDEERILKYFKNAKALAGKQAVARAWNKGEVPIMTLHAASAGHGNNFQDGGNIIVFFGTGWDLELYEQVIERIGPARQKASGYDRNVFVYRILARNTIDEVQAARIETKRSIQELLLEAAAKFSRTLGSEK